MKIGGFLNWRSHLETARAWWREKGTASLRAFSPYAWFPILTVASLSLLVSFCNYRLQSGGRPELEFTNGTIDPKARRLQTYWHNPGRMIAWGGKAKLFDVNDQGTRSDRPFADVEITGAGPKVFAGMGANMFYQFPSDHFPKWILVCATYDDQNGTSYQQKFLLRTVQKTDAAVLDLIEQLAPIEQNCP